MVPNPPSPCVVGDDDADGSIRRTLSLESTPNQINTVNHDDASVATVKEHNSKDTIPVTTSPYKAIHDNTMATSIPTNPLSEVFTHAVSLLAPTARKRVVTTMATSSLASNDQKESKAQQQQTSMHCDGYAMNHGNDQITHFQNDDTATTTHSKNDHPNEDISSSSL
eukprot:14057865-Ditylum_brightwellii.AAC.1